MIFLDFDGTLVDLWPRYHAVFCSLLGRSDISLNEYKTKKLSLKKDALIAKAFGEVLPLDYFAKKRALLEDESFLKLDRLIVSKDIINCFFKNRALIISKRNNIRSFERQLKWLGITIPYAIVCGDESKSDWIKNNVCFKKEKNYIIGDSLADLEVAENGPIYPIMLLSGLGTKAEFDSLKIQYDLYKTIEDYINKQKRKNI